jgi:hypothetical protein
MNASWRALHDAEKQTMNTSHVNVGLLAELDKLVAAAIDPPRDTHRVEPRNMERHGLQLVACRSTCLS